MFSTQSIKKIYRTTNSKINKPHYSYTSIFSLVFIFILPSTFSISTPLKANNEQKKLDSLKKFTTQVVPVSSTKATERVNSTTFSNLEKKDIEQMQSNQDLPLLLNILPSIVSYSENGNGIGYSNISIRGFDQRRIAVMINGIPQNDPEDHNLYWINYSDISESMDNIQVQRGAGLINYGSAAIAGSVNLEGLNYTSNRYIKLGTGVTLQEFGNNTFSSNASKFKFEYASGLINEKYALYGKVSRINSWGYRDNSQSFMNTYYLSAIRYDEGLSTQINIYGGSQKDGLAYYGIPKSYISDLNLRKKNYNYWDYASDGTTVNWATEMNKFETEEFTSPHFELINNGKLSEELSFSSSLFYFAGDGYFDMSGDGWTDASTYHLKENGWANAEDPRNPIIRAYVSNKQGGWIPKITWEHQGGELSLGAELRIHRSNHYGQLIYAENLPQGYDKDFKFYSYDGTRNIFSLFAREIINITSDKTINLELQAVNQTYAIGNEKFGNNYSQYYDLQKNIVSGQGHIFNINYFFLNPRLGFNWNIDENQNFYSLLALTQREPRMINLYNASESYSGGVPQFNKIQFDSTKVAYDFNAPIVKPETMLNFELGWNYKTDNLHFTSNVYLMEYFNELVSNGKLDIFGNPVDGNAKRTRHYGLELSAMFNIFNQNSHQLYAGGNATISSNKIVHYDYFTGADEKVSLDGNQIAGFSNFIASILVKYQYKNLSLMATGKYVGELKSDNFGDMLNSEKIKASLGSSYYADNTLDPYFVTNLFVKYKLEGLFDNNAINLQLSVNNLTNNLYAAMAKGRYFFVAAERSVFFGLEFEL